MMENVNQSSQISVSVSGREFEANEFSLLRLISFANSVVWFRTLYVPFSFYLDIDECSTSYSYVRRRLCGENAVCVNSPGSYSCQCEEGFSGDGHTCVSMLIFNLRCSHFPGSWFFSSAVMDQCTENLDQCDINARCISSATSFQCVCLDGYEGDGRTCTGLGFGYLLIEFSADS